ncbi:MAG: segregation/condensation protein A [Leuconostoc gelidum]|jgi:segregation and condensation protein A|uniref:segregation and condensation protein A n=1 Tax=Leuconostoc gelidum TaxID=1244 RepID=UPI0015769557|nr:segregation/condensation protein A [Leuconostoc gelidum]MBZ6001137.1 segregation/condensation protein A [Leuconostoc gelidum subsp. gelidum]QDJ29789.1 chromosome segregation protein ScpA [Leuconostoc gelidum subsp. gelidum]
MEKVVIGTHSLTIKLSDFEGPLDLLLHLIKQSEMDIFDLQIAKITEQYLVFIHEQKKMQLDVASEYLVMAATLVQIKSADLLPQETFEENFVEESYFDPREELMAQLLTYKQFQVASDQLREREKQHQQSFARLPLLPPNDVKLETKLAPGLELIDLQTAFAHLLKKKKQQKPISRRVISEKYTMAIAIKNIRQRFLAQKIGDMMTFDSLFDHVYDREPLVMTFLALLEMAKEDKVSLHQEDAQSEIFLKIEKLDDNE